MPTIEEQIAETENSIAKYTEYLNEFMTKGHRKIAYDFVDEIIRLNEKLLTLRQGS